MTLPLSSYDPDQEERPKKKPISEKAKEDSIACQKIILGYRNSIGCEKYGKAWNNHHFPILMATAKKMLALMENWQDAVQTCTQDTVERIKEKWNPEAEISLQGIYAKFAFKWKMDKLEREAKGDTGIKII